MAEIYDATRFGELYQASRQPSSDHLFLAAFHLSQICQNAGITHAFLGGWTVRLRGGERQTQDIDITVATTMDHFESVLLQMPRICFPEVHRQRAVTMFVQTGASYDQGYDRTSDLPVQVDVIISGHFNIPPNIDNTTSEIITLPNGFDVRVVNIYYLLQEKFHAFFTGGEASKKHYEDLVFLIIKYHVEMLRYSSHIEKEHRAVFLEEYAKEYGEEELFVQWMRQKLGLVESEA